MQNKVKRTEIYIVLIMVAVFLSSCQKSGDLSKEDLAIYQEALSEFEGKKFDTALEKVNTLQKSYSGNPEVIGLKGKILFYTRKFKESEQVFSNLAKNNPGSAYAWIWKGKAQAAQPETRDRALDSFQRALQVDPENARAYYYIGRLYEGRQMYKEAILSYQRSLIAEYQVSRTHLHMGLLFSKLGLDDRAKEHLLKVKQLKFNDYDIKQVDDHLKKHQKTAGKAH